MNKDEAIAAVAEHIHRFGLMSPPACEQCKERARICVDAAIARGDDLAQFVADFPRLQLEDKIKDQTGFRIPD